MATTTNYSWTTPDDTALVKDGAAAIRSLGTAIDTTVFNNAGAAIGKTIVDAKGDIIAATAGDTVARLAVGANDTVLTADSSTATGLKWAAPAASGGMTLLSTTPFTAASSISITSIDQTYNELVIVIENAATANTTTVVQMQFNSNTTATQYAYTIEGNAGGPQGFSSDADSKIFTTINMTSSANTNSIMGVFRIPRYTATTRKVITMNSSGISNGGVQFTGYGTGSFLGSAAISSVQISTNGGNFTAQGNIYIYGVK